MSDLPGVNRVYEDQAPYLAYPNHINGAPWNEDFRDNFPIASDTIRNHDRPAALGVLDGADNATEWSPYHFDVSDPISVGTQHEIALLGDPAYMQTMRIPQPDAIDTFDMQNTSGQAVLSGVESIAAMVPFIELPDHGQSGDPSALAGFGAEGGLPFHFDYGQQYTQGSAIGPRQIFRSPPTYGDQTAGMFAAGF